MVVSQLSNIYKTQLIQSRKQQLMGQIHYLQIPQLKKKIVSDIEFDDEENVKNEVALPIEIADELDIFFNPKHDNNDKQMSSTNDQNFKWLKSYIIQKPKLFYDEIKEVTKAMLESKIFT